VVKGVSYSYELVCSDVSGDLYDIVTKKINPALAELFNKYHPHRDHTDGIHRAVLIAYNEEDGARVEFTYNGYNATLEEVMVDNLFQYRDLLVENKLSFNAFRQIVAHIAFTAYTRSSSLYRDLEDLLTILNCKMKIRYGALQPSLSKEQASKLTPSDTPSVLSFEPREAVSLRLVLRDEALPLSEKIKVLYELPGDSASAPVELTLITDKNGEIVLPVRMFSKVKITLPHPVRSAKAVELPRGEEVKVTKIRGNQLEVIVGRNNVKLDVDVDRGKSLLYILIGATAVLAILLILLLI